MLLQLLKMSKLSVTIETKIANWQQWIKINIFSFNTIFETFIYPLLVLLWHLTCVIFKISWKAISVI